MIADNNKNTLKVIIQTSFTMAYFANFLSYYSVYCAQNRELNVEDLHYGIVGN